MEEKNQKSDKIYWQERVPFMHIVTKLLLKASTEYSNRQYYLYRSTIDSIVNVLLKPYRLKVEEYRKTLNMNRVESYVLLEHYIVEILHDFLKLSTEQEILKPKPTRSYMEEEDYEG